MRYGSGLGTTTIRGCSGFEDLNRKEPDYTVVA